MLLFIIIFSGDEIIEQLVQWTKSLPFYSELPVDVHTHLLTQRWPELVLLSACYYASSTTQANAVNSEEAQVTTTTIDGQDEVKRSHFIINHFIVYLFHMYLKYKIDERS